MQHSKIGNSVFDAPYGIPYTRPANETFPIKHPIRGRQLPRWINVFVRYTHTIPTYLKVRRNALNVGVGKLRYYRRFSLRERCTNSPLRIRTNLFSSQLRTLARAFLFFHSSALSFFTNDFSLSYVIVNGFAFLVYVHDLVLINAQSVRRFMLKISLSLALQQRFTLTIVSHQFFPIITPRMHFAQAILASDNFRKD